MRSLLLFNRRIKDFKFFLGERVWRYFLLGVILGVLWFLIESSFVVILQMFLVSIGLLEKVSSILPATFPSSMLATSGILVAFGLARGCVLATRYYYIGSTAQAFMAHQRALILEYGLLNASRLSTPEISLAYNDYTVAASAALSQLAGLLNNLVSISLFVLAGFYITPKEFILSIFLLSLVLIPMRHIGKKVRGYSEKINFEKEQANKILFVGIKNNFLLMIYNLIPSEIAKGKLRIGNNERIYRRYYRIAGMRNAFPQVMGVFVISIVAFASQQYFHTPGSKLLAFFYIFIRMSQSASEFYAVSGDIKIHLKGLRTLFQWNKKLLEFLQTDEEEVHLKSGEMATFSINISNLSFAYDNALILDKFNLNVSSGDILLIKGESGAGKSTLLSLILGIIKPTSGEILINGHSPHLIRSSLSKSIGYVGPEAFLIQGTIKDNLLYGLDKSITVTDEELWDVLKKSQLEREIDSLPRKLDEDLLERTQFSTGQKQRLAIARALLRKPSLLILDEATANLDPFTESKFVELLPSLAKKDMTTIIVSHKDSFDSISNKRIQLKKIDPS